ncbi:uncharacterized protein LOC126832293 [Patella vulgata]|uniref:uncharacterized protein LOC126832293 n=1 Tax=Patella vulgata TaxID=6465 RepID=UPI0024A8D9EB|nr:uncharacterized protein LOC126832293 [Patella vulgata]
MKNCLTASRSLVFRGRILFTMNRNMIERQLHPLSTNTSTVDLRSDTVTTPTQEMYDAMISSPVGDDVFKEDPTVTKLQEKCAKLFGKDAALFVPSGTMGNLISVMAHCQSRLLEAIVGSQSHILLYEVGGLAHFGGVQLRSVHNKADGTFDLDEASGIIRNKDDIHQPSTALICLENTHNKCGGKVLPISFLEQVQEFAKKHDLKCHMDGARLLNAAIYMDRDPADILQYVDSVSLCFSKGLSCPVGSIIAGTHDFISRARWLRKALGGGMRQIGVLAGPAIVGLDTIYPKLYLDHQRTKQIATAIHENSCEVVEVDLDGIHTNILMVHMTKSNFDAAMFCNRLAKVTDEERQILEEDICILGLPFSNKTARLVLHHNIDQNKVDKTIKKLKYVLKEMADKNNL